MISSNKVIASLIFIDMLVQLTTRKILSIHGLTVCGDLLHGFITIFFFLGAWINGVRLLFSKDIPRGLFGAPFLSVFSPYAELSLATKRIRMNIFKYLGATFFLVGYTVAFGMAGIVK